jgi:hypothetical protein
MTYFGRTAVPTDLGTGTGPNVTIPPPASMAAGDAVYVVICTRSVSATITNTTSGGQTWTPGTNITQGTVICRTFSCIFDGTWTADPVFNCSDAGSTAMSGVMVVARADSGTAELDVADASAGFANPTTPFDVTTTGITVAANSCAIASWTSKDDNTWALQTGGWTNPSGEAQWRNTSGSDISISIGYQAFTSAGGTGNVTNRQLTLGGDEGMQSIVSFREVAGGGGGDAVPQVWRQYRGRRV